MLDHAVAYATFPNNGKAVTPHAMLEVRTGDGELVWRFDRDGPKPTQAIPRIVAADMAGMMSQRGRGRHRAARAARRHPGRRQDRHHQRLSRRLVRRLHRQFRLRRSGTATTITTPTNRMTGGSLPAQTWHDIMVVAHQGVEIKELAGVGPCRRRAWSRPSADGKSKSGTSPPPRPTVLTKRGADILVQVERMMDDATRAMGPLPPTVSAGKEKQAAIPNKGDALATALDAGHASAAGTD